MLLLVLCSRSVGALIIIQSILDIENKKSEKHILYSGNIMFNFLSYQCSALINTKILLLLFQPCFFFKHLIQFVFTIKNSNRRLMHVLKIFPESRGIF